MRQHRPAIRLAAVLLITIGLAGCKHCFIDAAQSARLASAEPEQASKRVIRRSPRRVVKPKTVVAGDKLRQFCGDRHVQFQAGTLKEPPDVMARNNDLCRQLYKS